MKTLTFEQMEKINAGGWIREAWNAVCNAVETAWEWCKDHVGARTTAGGAEVYVSFS